MKTVLIKFASWDKVYYFDPGDLFLLKGDSVIVDTEFGEELGVVVDLKEVSENDFIDSEDKKENDTEEGKKVLKKVLHKASREEIEKVKGKKERKEALEYCKQMVTKHNLEMKLVDVLFSFSGNRITFAFIADGRVDFRELVKDLTSRFNKMIRLTQIGIRDEAKLCGDCGHCGRELCCRGFIRDFESITSEMAEAQQVVHRGSDRISGVCGRLMCCLQYEQLGYRELAEKMPAIGTRVNVDGRRGVVIGIHVLKQTVDVEFDDSKDGKTIMEVDLNRHGKKQS